MLSGRQLHGLAVIDQAKSQEMGRISDVIADRASGKISGFIISGNNILSKTYFLPIDQVARLDLRGAAISSGAALQRIRKTPSDGRLADWRGSRVLDSSGRDRGTVADILVDNKMICGLEVSTGLWGDLARRRDFLSWENVRPNSGAFMQIDQSLS